MGREEGVFRGVAGWEQWEERGVGVAGVQQRDVLRGPPPVGAAAAVVSNTDHAAHFFFFLNVRFLRPAAPSGNLEEGGAGFRRRGRRAAVTEGVWRSLFCFVCFFLAKVIPISVNPPAG